MTNKEIIGKGITNIRRKLGLKQKGLAAALDISNGYLSEIEAGKKNPGIEILDKLFVNYNVNVTYLFTGKGDMFIHQEKEAAQKKSESPVNVTAEVLDYINELKWYLDNIPVVRFALLEFFKSYLFGKRDMIEHELEIFKQKNSKENQKK
jgi:transcriptional regulator with XRE-family HTH domain